MAYIPRSKYRVAYTNGSEYSLDGSPYKGNYLILTTGQRLAGNDPDNIKGKLIPLINNARLYNVQNGNNNSLYSILKPQRFNEQNNYLAIPRGKNYPEPINYNEGFFNRYLVARLNTKTYFEVNETTYSRFNSRRYNTNLYSRFKIEWSLKENNKEINTKILRSLEPNLPGIFDFFPDKEQFKPQNGIIILDNINNIRMYPNGTSVPQSLPRIYQIGNFNEIKNKKVPKNQNCGNCFLAKKGYCNRWEAEVNLNYWCAAWKVITPVSRRTDNPTSSRPTQSTVSRIPSSSPSRSTPSIGRGGY